MGFTLYPFQAAAAESAEGAAYRVRRALVVSPTGTGKSMLIRDGIRRAHARGESCLALVHRHELLIQLSQKLHESGLAHGYIKAGLREQRGQQIQLASVQTLIRREIPPADWVFVDESHRNDFRKIEEMYPEAKILGYTATPISAGGKTLHGRYEDMIVAITYPDAVDHKYIHKGRIWVPHRPDMRGVRIMGGDFSDEDLEREMSQQRVVKDIVGHWMRLSRGRMTIGFCVNVAHAEQVRDAFKEAGINCEIITGETDANVRAGLLARLRGRTLDILLNVGVFVEGLDIPELETVMLCRPTKSLSLHLQMCGRGCRTSNGKDTYFILDFAGNCILHGPPWIHRQWSLDPSEWTRTCKLEADKIHLRMCQVCLRSYTDEDAGPHGACPECNTPRSNQRFVKYEKNGGLVEMTDTPLKRAPKLAKTPGKNSGLRQGFAIAKKLGIPNAQAFAKKHAAKVEQKKKLVSSINNTQLILPSNPDDLW